MAKNREAIFQALKALVENAMGRDVLVTRVFYMPDACPRYPIVMVLEQEELADYEDARMPATWTLGADIRFIDKWDGDNEDAPAAPLHAFLDALESALGSDKTLGGTCQYARIEGQVMKNPPDSQDPFMYAVVPVEIRAVG